MYNIRIKEIDNNNIPNGWKIHPNSTISEFFIQKEGTTTPKGFVNIYEYNYIYATLVKITREGIDYLIPFKKQYILENLEYSSQEKVKDLKEIFKKETSEFLPIFNKSIEKEINELKKYYIIPKENSLNFEDTMYILLYKIKINNNDNIK